MPTPGAVVDRREVSRNTDEESAIEFEQFAKAFEGFGGFWGELEHHPGMNRIEGTGLEFSCARVSNHPFDCDVIASRVLFGPLIISGAMSIATTCNPAARTRSQIVRVPQPASSKALGRLQVRSCALQAVQFFDPIVLDGVAG